MEFRIDQVLLVVAVIVATLFDLFTRLQRRKRGGAPMPDAGGDDRWVVVDAEEGDSDEADERLVPTPREAERRGAVTYRPPPGASPSPVDRQQPTYRSPLARSVTFGAPIARRVGEAAIGPARANARKRGRSRGWTQLRNSDALKRAIVLAEILGPCRGLQRPGEGER